MMSGILVLALFHNVGGTIFSDTVTDLVKSYGRTAMVTEFSCNKKESALLAKKLMQSDYQCKVLPVNIQDIEYPIPPNYQIFVLNLQCASASNLIQLADDLKLFASPFRWIFYHNNTSTESVLERYFSQIHILIDSDVSLCELQNNNTVCIKKIYRKRENYEIEIEDMGYWDGKINDTAFDKNTVRRRKNLMGTKINTCIVITHPDSLNHLTDKRDKHIDSITKVNYVLMEHIKDVINATLNYSIQGTWGYKNNKSEWSGMMGELTRNEADIGGTPLFFTVDRVDLIDYIAMTTPTRSKFVFRQPKLSYVTNVFTLPFDTYVWISTVCLIIIISVVLFVVIKWEWWKKKYKKYEDTSGELRDSISDCVLLSFGAMCQQGATAIPLSIPGKITTILLFISLMFLYTSYSANIVALLQSSSNSIQTLDDLLKSRLQIGVDDTVFNRFYFPNATEPVRRAIYLQKVAPPGKQDHFMTIDEGVRKMRQGLFAFHMETGPGYKIVSEVFHEAEKCGLQEIQFLQVIDPWLAVQKNSSYKGMLKIGLRKLQESGLQTREVSLIYTKKPVCTSRGSSFISVGLVDCYPAIVVLVGGIFAALAVFILEIYVNYRLSSWKHIRDHFCKTTEKRTDEVFEVRWPYAN